MGWIKQKEYNYLENKGWGWYDYFNFNGSTNYIDTGVKVQGGQPIDFKIKVQIDDLSVVHDIITCQYATIQEGFRFYSRNNANFQMFVGDGINVWTYVYPLVLNTSTIYDVHIQWSGISGEVLTLTINGTDYTTIPTTQWSGDSYKNLKFGGGELSYLDGKILEYSYTINGNSEVSKTLDKDYDGTISGTVNDYQWGYNVKIPALADKTTCVDGTAITNPAIDGLNYGAEYYKQRAVYNDLYNADTSNKWYESDGTIKEVTTFVRNFNRYSYANTNEETFAKNILTYGTTKSDEDEKKISLCQAKENGCSFVLDTNGDYQFDANNNVITVNCNV